MDGFLLLRNIKVENANCVAGQTWGFPAISNFLGFTHALQRQLAEHQWPKLHLQFTSCAVVCHKLEPQTHKSGKYSEHVFALSRNPLTKEAKTASFVEEGRVNMTVSVLIGIEKANFGNQQQPMEEAIQQLVPMLRLAGGTITQLTKARLVTLKDDEQQKQQQVNFWMRTLLPGHTLVARPQLLAEHSHKFGSQTNQELSAWLDNSTIHINPDKSITKRDYSGWIKPIVVGYRGISELYQPGEVAKSRDQHTPVRFVEYAYSLGEWLSPHRINQLEQIMWQYSSNPDEAESGWYLCHNHYEQLLTNTTEQKGH